MQGRDAKPRERIRVSKKKAAPRKTRGRQQRKALQAKGERHRVAAAKYARKVTAAACNIGNMPPCANPTERRKCEGDFKAFCKRYFSELFYFDWSEDHLRVIKKIEAVVLESGMFGIAMPRGSGKTTLAEIASLWATLYGKRKFVFVVADNQKKADKIMDSVKMHLQVNDLLKADFPEVCFPIMKLRGTANRAPGQTSGEGEGELTHIEWSAGEIVYASVRDVRGEWGPKGSFYPSCGAIFQVTGMTGSIRGAKHVRADGKAARPDLVLIDDPQDDEVAASPVQCERRERIIKGAVIGLAGPGKKIAALATVTIIRPGDLSDRILDREKNPHWQAERTKTLYALPRNAELWEEYRKLLAADEPDDVRNGNAAAFYVANRKAMDEGAIVAWPSNFTPPYEVSGLQRAMNLKILDERMFAAEYQNDPLPDDFGQDDKLTVEIVLGKINGYKRGLIPTSCETMTMFVDVQSNLLYYVVCAWAREFTGYVVDYGTWPQQPVPYFTYKDATVTLRSTFPRDSTEGAIARGLAVLTEQHMSREWPREDGARVRIDRCLIDMGYQAEVVRTFCRNAPFAASLLPSKGRGIRAADAPMESMKFKAGEKNGLNWYIPLSKGHPVRHVEYDTNFWKSFLRSRFHTAIGDSGALSIHKDRDHRLFAEHMTSEFSVRTAGRGREIDEWKLRPEKPDNHWFDCAIGCAVAASIVGVSHTPTGPSEVKRVRKKVNFAEWAQRVQGGM